MHNGHRWFSLALFGLAAACGDTSPSAPKTPGSLFPQNGPTAQALACVASVADRTVQCTPDTSPGTAKQISKYVRNAIFIGGQGVYVQMTSSNIAYDGTFFTFDASVQSLIPQIMGTNDGETADGEGVQIFFASGPEATLLANPSGSAAISVDNPDGTGTFTGSFQPYYVYNAELGGDGMLEPNETSGTKLWRFAVDPNVLSFSFFVYISTNVHLPQGYVDVTGGSDYLLEGTGATLSGTVRTAVGNTPTNPDPIVWSSSDEAIATVDASGNVTAVAPGRVTITATSGTRLGTKNLSVCPDLAVGETYEASGAALANTCFSGGASGNAEYTYMPVNVSTTSAVSLSATGSGIVAVTGPPTPNLLPGTNASFRPSVSLASFDLSGLKTLETPTSYDPVVERRDRDREEIGTFRNGKRIAGGVSVQRNTSTGGYRYAVASPPPPRHSITPGVPSLGDLMTLNVATGCSGAVDDRIGMVRSIGTNVIIISDTANPPGGFTTAQYDSIRLEYDSLTSPVITQNFGNPTDLDNNNRVILFYTRAVNELSPPASSVVTMGYSTARDLFSTDPVSGCPRSNYGEIMYMLVPDPTGSVNSNVRSVSQVRGATIAKTAEELQVLISNARRIHDLGTSTLEEGWLSAGLSSIASELIFYRTSVGLAPGNNIVVTNLTTGPNASRRVAAFNTYANPNFGRMRSFMQRPDTIGIYASSSRLAQQGILWAFLRYAADRHGGTQSAFWNSFNTTTLTGMANLENAIGANLNDWMVDFYASIYGDDAVTGVATQYQNLSWSFRSLQTQLNGSTYPLLTRPLTNGVSLTLSYNRTATSYLRFGVPTGAFADITLLTAGNPPSDNVRMIVMRTK